jgi:hypothetical protein
MAHAICLKAYNSSGDPIRTLWAEFGRFEPTSSMAALNYPPHITLAIYDGVDEFVLCAATAAATTLQPRCILRATESRLVVGTRSVRTAMSRAPGGSPPYRAVAVS